MASGFELLTQGRIFESILQPYIDLLGIFGSSVVFMFFTGILIALIYIKTKSIELISAILIISGALLGNYLLPTLRPHILIIISVALALVIYRLLWKRRVYE